jgi:hypothetical protein
MYLVYRKKKRRKEKNRSEQNNVICEEELRLKNINV